MKKIANLIINYRNLLLITTLFLTIGSFFLLTKVNVNYDITKYLPDNIETTNALKIMEQEFGELGQAFLMVEDIDIQTALKIKADIKFNTIHY